MTYEFRPRRVRFDYSATPRHWVPDDPQTTHVLNVLHLLLPAGERWFCDVYREALPLIEDEALRRDVRAFIGQEATHARAHAGVLGELGVDATAFTRLVEAGFHVVRVRSMWSWLPARVRAWLAREYLLSQLSGIAAIEHFTAVMGWWIVTSRGLDEAGADPEMMALLRWHGAEEVEHRSVAFDAYRAAGGGYGRRSVGILGVFAGMFATWFVATDYLLRQEGRRASLRHFVRAGRRGVLPTTKDLVVAVPRYLAPRYHPSSEGRTDVAAAYLAEARGVLERVPA